MAKGCRDRVTSSCFLRKELSEGQQNTLGQEVDKPLFRDADLSSNVSALLLAMAFSYDHIGSLICLLNVSFAARRK